MQKSQIWLTVQVVVWIGITGGIILFVKYFFYSGQASYNSVNPDAITIILSALGIMLAVLAILIGILAIFGYSWIEKQAVNRAVAKAKAVAINSANEIIRDVVQNTNNIATDIATRTATDIATKLVSEMVPKEFDKLSGKPEIENLQPAQSGAKINPYGNEHTEYGDE